MSTFQFVVIALLLFWVVVEVRGVRVNQVQLGYALLRIEEEVAKWRQSS